MNHDQLNEPLNQIVAAFANSRDARAATDDVREIGIDDERIELLEGAADSVDVPTRPHWFADTHQDLRRFHDALNDGGCVLSVCTEDKDELHQIRNVFQRHEAKFVFHFGKYTTTAL